MTVASALELLRRLPAWMRSRMTPGQRWTGALATAMALVMLTFGMSPRVPPTVRASPPQVALPALAGPDVSPATAVLVPPGPFGPLPALGPTSPSVGAVVSDAAVATVFPPPRFVALLRVNPSDPTGRDDAAIGRVFVSRSGLPVTSVDGTGNAADVCQKVAAAGNVVLAGTGPDGAVVDCLVRRGVTVIAYDAGGDRPPSAPGGGQVVSTRRGTADSLVDLARWGATSGVLTGKVGIAASAGLEAVVKGALPAMRAAGVDVGPEKYVAADGPTAEQDISDGVLAFSGAGVDVALFALPVRQQARWATLARTIDAGARFVTSDAEDGIIDESYPPVFDGALTFTSLRVPWFARAHGETPAQAGCRAVWEADHATLLSGAETVAVFAWCEAVALLVATVRETPPGGDLGAALRRHVVASPLTSDLGPLPTGGFGPGQSAALIWTATCACWTEKTPFASRP